MTSKPDVEFGRIDDNVDEVLSKNSGMVCLKNLPVLDRTIGRRWQ